MMTPELVLTIVLYCNSSPVPDLLRSRDACIQEMKKCVMETLTPTYADSLFFCIGRERK